MNTYLDKSWNNVTYQWHNARMRDSIVTKRGTLVEMVESPYMGVTCYMDNEIQSCEADEYLYHESLVHPVMSTGVDVKRVMVIGGGEGATAREVLKWRSVTHVDMYEWDKDVVSLFQNKYPRCAKGAWNDHRLNIMYEDIFEVIVHPPQIKYDVIIIDLFDPTPENMEQWNNLLMHLQNWISPTGSIVMYAGIREFTTKKQPYRLLWDMISKQRTPHIVTPYRVFIPSYLGEAIFLLITPMSYTVQCNPSVITHITPDIWRSYHTFNW